MKRKLFLVFILSFYVFSAYAQKYRWDVKILIDSAGLRIYKQKAKAETISNLANPSATPRPEKKELTNGKRAHAEKRKVTVTAYVIATGREGDGDYHLVLKALNSKKTLIAEIPDPDIKKIKGFPSLKNDFSSGRKEVDDQIGKPPHQVKNLLVKRKVRITGIVFFDKIAHGNGHADNGIEIHPVLAFKVLD